MQSELSDYKENDDEEKMLRNRTNRKKYKLSVKNKKLVIIPYLIISSIVLAYFLITFIISSGFAANTKQFV